MDKDQNLRRELAFRFVNETNKHIFLTGKAGTGKTTFLRDLMESTRKRAIVAAPTGVAAINAGGVTIHSLFQLPFGPLLPGQKRNSAQERRFRKSKINLLRSLDLLVIDEISMVRADVMDAINEVLKRYRHSNESFGGVQVLMIGDLYQLPPVVKRNEWDLLRAHYDSMYFFGSHVIRQSDMLVIELEKVYRQTDHHFLSLLNQIRNNENLRDTVHQLNARYQPSTNTENHDEAIILTSHLKSAQRINDEKLALIRKGKKTFRCEVEGTFPSSSFPNDEVLELKEGARVMFIKNDISEGKEYYNGKLGMVTSIDDDEILVSCDDGSNVYVGQVTWENTTFKLNEKSKELEEEVIGTFTQYPLRLAWAITIHKSQGLTFDKVTIDAENAFAHGQVYVALSRCRTLEGITMSTQLDEATILTDHNIRHFEAESQKRTPNEGLLQKAKKEYECHLLNQLFSFNSLKAIHQNLLSLVLREQNSLLGEVLNECNEAGELLFTKVIQVSEKFQFKLNQYFQSNSQPSANETLMKRLSDAGHYFHNQLQEEIYPKYERIEIITDNTTTRKRVESQLEEIRKSIYVKGVGFKTLIDGFDPGILMTARANADLDFEKKAGKSKKKSGEAYGSMGDQSLYSALSEWRDHEAQTRKVSLYEVITTRSLIELSTMRPATKSDLKKIHGLGKKRIAMYGDTILEIIGTYSAQYPSDEGEMTYEAQKKTKAPSEKGASQRESIAMFKSGKSIEKIAKERNLTITTIKGHMAYGIRKGDLDIHDFVASDKIEKAVAYFREVDHRGLTPARQHLGEEYSFAELRMVVSHLEYLAESGKI